MEHQLAEEIFLRFQPDADIRGVSELRAGSVNRTYLVETAAETYICQRLSRVAFRGAADAIAYNYLRYREAYSAVREQIGGWEIPQWMRTEDGTLFSEDDGGDWWRAYPMIPARTMKRAGDLPAGGIGQFARGLAVLHFILDRFAGRPRTVIAGFHDLEQYLEEYRRAAPSDRAVPELDRMIEAYGKDLGGAAIRADAVIHADTKLGNAIFDECGRVVAFIDIDTISAGSRLIDVADSIRSIASGAVEDARFDRDAYDAFVSAYVASPFCGLTDAEIEQIPRYLLRITFELGLRFYTDYLQGSVYFHADRPEETLERALRQFRLAEETRRCLGV